MFNRVLFACVTIFAAVAITGCGSAPKKEDAPPPAAEPPPPPPPPPPAPPPPPPAAAPAPAPLAPGACATDADCHGKGRCMHGTCR